MSIVKSALLFLGAAQPVPDVHDLIVTDMDYIVAYTIEGEARGEDKFGRELVADVIGERMKRRNKSACAVCIEANQFAGSSYRGNVSYHAIDLAMKLRWGWDILPEYSFTHFYSGNFAPRWAQGKKVYQHGGHYFLELDE